MNFRLILFLGFLTSGSLLIAYGQGGNLTNDSVSYAKKELLKLYSDRMYSFYCGCSFNKKKYVDWSSCGYEPLKKTSKRAKKIEWEHVVPASAFGRTFSEWTDGDPECVDSMGEPFKGRDCAQKMNEEYRRMQADMHNLYPVIGEVNMLRSDNDMGMIDGEKRIVGLCDIEVESGIFEPPVDSRGDIARTYMYMEYAYPYRNIVTENNWKLFEKWNRDDPVTKFECLRNRLIEKVQGNNNIIIENACIERGY